MGGNKKDFLNSGASAELSLWLPSLYLTERQVKMHLNKTESRALRHNGTQLSQTDAPRTLTNLVANAILLMNVNCLFPRSTVSSSPSAFCLRPLGHVVMVQLSMNQLCCPDVEGE